MNDLKRPTIPTRKKLSISEAEWKDWRLNEPIFINSGCVFVRKTTPEERAAAYQLGVKQNRLIVNDEKHGKLLFISAREYLQHYHFVKYGPCVVRAPRRGRILFSILQDPCVALLKKHSNEMDITSSSESELVDTLPAIENSKKPEECQCKNWAWTNSNNEVIQPITGEHHPICSFRPKEVRRDTERVTEINQFGVEDIEIGSGLSDIYASADSNLESDMHKPNLDGKE